MQTNTFFIGHGSPMNIIAENVFTKNMSSISNSIQKPTAILVISAHWITDGVQMTSANPPKQIYDFGGFPDELYKIKYQPPGAPKIVKDFTESHHHIQATHDWGLDHGTWAVLHHMYPQQNVPVFQLSLNRNFNIEQHFELAQELKSLKNDNVLIIGSGNIVHNLRQISWDPDAPAQSWAVEYETTVLNALTDQNLTHEERLEKIFGSPLLRQAHPSLDHLIPLIYTMGSGQETSQPEVLIKGLQNGSISMASVKF